VSGAVGSARFALGTDAAGSVRIPAAMTGTVGLKPTTGLISSIGVLRQATAPSIDHVGIIARTAEEVAHVLQVIAGPDPLDPRTLQGLADPPLQSAHKPLELEGSRFAILGEKTRAALNQVYELDPEIADAFETACAVFREAGAEIATVELLTLANAIEAVVSFFSAELAAAHRGLFSNKKDTYHPDVAEMLEESFAMPPERLKEAVRIRLVLRREFEMALAEAQAELLLTPTTPRGAMLLSGFEPRAELGTLIPYTCGFNLIGNPAISVPCGFTGKGLPIGLQIAGVPFADATVLAFAHAFQLRTSWHLQRPPLTGLSD
jgi:Asp-tRNA(Asn)/Glu-tRNA(Gln) amidotransferase A subunit family amidase